MKRNISQQKDKKRKNTKDENEPKKEEKIPRKKKEENEPEKKRDTKMRRKSPNEKREKEEEKKKPLYIWYSERNGWECEIWKTAFPYTEELAVKYKELNKKFDTLYATKASNRKIALESDRRTKSVRNDPFYAHILKQEIEKENKEKDKKGLKYTVYPGELPLANYSFSKFEFELDHVFDKKTRDLYVENSDSGYCDYYNSLHTEDPETILSGLDSILDIQGDEELFEQLNKNNLLCVF